MPIGVQETLHGLAYPTWPCSLASLLGLLPPQYFDTTIFTTITFYTVTTTSFTVTTTTTTTLTITVTYS